MSFEHFSLSPDLMGFLISAVEPVPLISRWAHVGAAVVLVGGVFFTRFALLPAFESRESSDGDDSLRSAVIGKWRRYVMIGTLLLLISGFYNYLAVGSHKGDGLYHGMMGVKILLALAVMFLGAVLTGRSPKFDAMRAKSRTWLSVSLVLAAIIIGIAGFLKMRGTPLAVGETEQVNAESVAD